VVNFPLDSFINTFGVPGFILGSGYTGTPVDLDI